MGILTGRSALITGSTAGIGQALALGYAEEGAQVWVHGRNEEAGRELARQIDGNFIRADLGSPHGVSAVMLALQGVDRIDVLVNNAAVEVPMAVADLNPGRLDVMWQVNFRAPVLLTSKLLPKLSRSSAASVINVTSIHQRVAYAQNSIYASTKAALAMFTRTAAIELAPSGIRVNNLAPGAIETEMNREVLDSIGRDRFANWIPAGRVGSVEDVVAPAVFLASDASAYMTGATLTIDGGYSEHLVRYRPLG